MVYWQYRLRLVARDDFFKNTDTSMRTLSRLRGFSLIELMIVIAILALMLSGAFAAFGPARSKGYDARRLSDMKTVQGILESYFVRCGIYPGDRECKAVTVADWNALRTVLRASKINATNIPDDPAGANLYKYYVSANGLHYVLKAKLENPNNEAIKGSLSTDDAKQLVGSGFSDTCESLNDGSTGGTLMNYCVGI